MCDTSLTSSTASQSKLCFDTSMDSDKDGKEDMDIIGDGQGHTLLELAGLQLAIQQAACCNVCGTGRLRLREDFSNRHSLFTRPYLLCEQCPNVTYIPFSTSDKSKIYAVNQRSVFATWCIGGNYSSLAVFCGMCDLPSLVSRRTYL